MDQQQQQEQPLEEEEEQQPGKQEAEHLLSTMFCEGEHMELKSADEGYEGSWYLVKVTALSAINESAEKLQQAQANVTQKEDLLVVPYEDESKQLAKVKQNIPPSTTLACDAAGHLSIVEEPSA